MKTLDEQAHEAGYLAVWDKLAEVMNSNDEVSNIYNKARADFLKVNTPKLQVSFDGESWWEDNSLGLFRGERYFRIVKNGEVLQSGTLEYQG